MDIITVLERKPKDLWDARKVRSKEWIKKLQGLIDLDPTRSMRDLAADMECGKSTISVSIKEDLRSSSLPPTTPTIKMPSAKAAAKKKAEVKKSVALGVKKTTKTKAKVSKKAEKKKAKTSAKTAAKTAKATKTKAKKAAAPKAAAKAK